MTRKWFILCVVATQAGCVSMLLAPPQVKSDTYAWTAPPPSWHKIDPGTADVAFQQDADRATISLDSICDEYQDETLAELAKSLKLGLSESRVETVEKAEAGGLPGLTTTISGTMDATPVVVRMTVLRSERCVYDFMLVGRPDAFARERQVFADLVQEFRERPAH